MRSYCPALLVLALALGGASLCLADPKPKQFSNLNDDAKTVTEVPAGAKARPLTMPSNVRLFAPQVGAKAAVPNVTDRKPAAAEKTTLLREPALRRLSGFASSVVKSAQPGSKGLRANPAPPRNQIAAHLFEGTRAKQDIPAGRMRIRRFRVVESEQKDVSTLGRAID